MDLSTRKIIDLLPERTVESVIAWLEAHPEGGIVSRDRGGVYVVKAESTPSLTPGWHLRFDCIMAHSSADRLARKWYCAARRFIASREYRDYQ